MKTVDKAIVIRIKYEVLQMPGRSANTERKPKMRKNVLVTPTIAAEVAAFAKKTGHPELVGCGVPSVALLGVAQFDAGEIVAMAAVVIRADASGFGRKAATVLVVSEDGLELWKESTLASYAILKAVGFRCESVALKNGVKYASLPFPSEFGEGSLIDDELVFYGTGASTDEIHRLEERLRHFGKPYPIIRSIDVAHA